MRLGFLVAILVASKAFAAAPEVRGTWLTTTANEAISTPQNTAATMKNLRAIGLNTVYVECWKNGYTEFPSETLRKTIGVEMKINASPSGAIQRDLLQETLIQAHRNQLIYIAWFEYGFMAAHKNTQNELRARKDWLSVARDGNEVAANGFVWLNPLHPDAQNLLLGIVKDAIRNYDIDGIQLDDRIVWPSIEMGYDDYTKKLYAAEHDGRFPPEAPREPEWMAWRQKKVEQFAKRFVKEIREAGGPDLLISLSPGPHPWALDNYLIDWPAWSRCKDSPTWDEFVPQVYRTSYAAFEKDWNAQVKFAGDRAKDLIAGIRLVGDGPDLPAQDVIKSIELVRRTNAMGHCWWFSRGVLEVYPELIAKIYNVEHTGYAPHPRLKQWWRPPPVVAQRQNDGNWRAEISIPGRYSVLWRENGTWTRERSRKYAAGPQQVLGAMPHASPDRVEVLLERRPIPDVEGQR